MFGFFSPRYPHRSFRHERRHGLGRQLLWGLLIGPWLFRRVMRWGMGGQRGRGQRGWSQGSGHSDPRYL